MKRPLRKSYNWLMARGEERRGRFSSKPRSQLIRRMKRWVKRGFVLIAEKLKKPH
ncbi:hypothetical protein J7L27_00395 [Candidatus Bathyarchaeota archaeon]|nr:hypothetical protein [Candidatus Bathyarchaeota archaeon]